MLGRFGRRHEPVSPASVSATEEDPSLDAIQEAIRIRDEGNRTSYIDDEGVIVRRLGAAAYLDPNIWAPDFRASLPEDHSLRKDGPPLIEYGTQASVERFEALNKIILERTKVIRYGRHI